MRISVGKITTPYLAQTELDGFEIKTNRNGDAVATSQCTIWEDIRRREEREKERV